MGRVAEPLEAIHLDAQERIDRAELIRDEELPAGSRDAGELGDGELGAPHVMENTMTADEIELGVAVGEAHHVGLFEAGILGRGRARGLEILDTRVDADDLRHLRSESERHGAGAASSVEDRLVPRERPEEPAQALREVGAPLLLQGQAQLHAHVAASALASERASSSASSRVEIVPAARSSSMRSRIRPIAGPGSRPSSSPRTSGADGSASRAASTTPTSSCEPT